MKKLKLIIVFVIVLGGVVGAFMLMQGGASSVDCPKKVKCDVCGDEFASDNAMEAHKTSAHIAVQYVCRTCNKAFTSQASAVSHIKNEHSLIICDICGQIFNDKTHLNKHKNDKHHFICEECGPDVWFITQAELDYHINHTKVKGTNRPHKR